MTLLRPSPVPWAAAALLSGFLSGSLFQGYARTGVGFFRMFATIAVVVAGYALTRCVVALHQRAALEALREQLGALPPGWRVDLAPHGAAPLAGPPLQVEAPGARFLVGLTATGPVWRAGGALVAMRRAARALWRVARALSPTSAAGPQAAGAGWPQLVLVPMGPVPRLPEWVDGVAVTAPDGLNALLRRLAGATAAAVASDGR